MGSPCTIVTGKPGNGKTLNTLKELDAQAVNEGRVVYYHNIRGLKPEMLKAPWYEFDEPLEWFKLPENSLVVIDEAQGFFPVRDPRKAVPDHCAAIETIRHEGRELWLITQDPNFLDVHVRRLCNRHIHFKRIFKSSKVLRHEWSDVMDVSKAVSYKTADTMPITLDKKFFGAYESTKQGSLHFFKFRPPLALYVVIAAVAASGWYGYRFYERYIEKTTPEASTAVETTNAGTVAGSVANGVAKALIPGAGDGEPSSTQRYLDQRTPRVASVPSSAPIYDDLTKPVSFPRTYCLSSHDEGFLERQGVRKRMKVGLVDGKKTGCGCYTQQGTLVTTSFEYCMNAVTNGIFDPTIPDRGAQMNAMVLPGQSAAQPGAGVRDAGALRALGGDPSATLASSGEIPGAVRVTVVPDTSRNEKPWSN